jgi:hypothetical protein
MAGAAPDGGGPTVTRACAAGSYQCTPAGSEAAPVGTATYSSRGKRPPAEPAARKSQVAYGRSIVRTTPEAR